MPLPSNARSYSYHILAINIRGAVYLCEKKTLPAEKALYTQYALHMTASWYICICDASTFLNLIYTNNIHTFRHFEERSETSMTRKSTCKNISEDANLPVSQKPSKYRASYAQIRHLMKRLSIALSSKLKEGRPRKYCTWADDISAILVCANFLDLIASEDI